MFAEDGRQIMCPDLEGPLASTELKDLENIIVVSFIILFFNQMGCFGPRKGLVVSFRPKNGIHFSETRQNGHMDNINTGY